MVYDPYAQRWYASSADGATSTSSTSNFLLAVSNTADPTQGWKGWRIPSDSNQDQTPDFDTLGFNKTGVYLTANMYGIGSGPFGVHVVAVNKNSLLNGTLTYAKVENTSVPATAQQTIDLDNSSSSASIWSNAGTNGVHHSPITYDPVANTISFGANTISTTNYAAPPAARQPDVTTTIATGDERLSAQVTKIGGVLWGTQAISVANRAAIRWFKINAANNALLQEGTIADPNVDYYYGSVAANEGGDAVIGFTASSDVLGPQGQKRFPSAYAVVGASLNNNPLLSTTFGSPMLLAAGVATYEVGSAPVRWGDYSSTTLDPTNHTQFWTIQEFASAKDVWSTQITEIQITEIVVPKPGYWSGTGNWSNPAWATGSGGPYSNAWTPGNDAYFEGTAGTVAISPSYFPTVNSLNRSPRAATSSPATR